MNKTSLTFLALVCVVLAFTVGYRIGDSRGYTDGYNEGYRYDCKEEIADLYKRVKNQSKALDYTDSTIRLILRENDSLKRKEHYQKRHEERLDYLKRFADDSVKYYKYVKKYNDSLQRVIEPHINNLVRADGSVDQGVCMFFEIDIPECADGWHISSTMEQKKSSSRKSRKGRK